MLSNTITQKIQDAMRSKDELRLSTLRMLASAFNYEKIAKQHELNEEEELAVIAKEAKKRKDAIEAYEKAGAVDRAQKEKDELKILQEFLPEEMNDEDLEKTVEVAVAEIGAVDIKDLGRVIGAVKDKVGGRADGARIADMVKNKLMTGGR